MIIEVDCVVIGAGVVGLAIAKSISSSGREVYVLESADRIGTQTSSHNSEVMHAGLYYKTDSLKAQFCLEGYRKLQSYCSGRGIGFKKIGKLISPDKEEVGSNNRSRSAKLRVAEKI
mgnify:CR=1 FL=1